ncbi:unnamed protein product [Blepharisma stoltei]|uniref:Pentatricopeptide repeat-containing protein n=1 Tax=Blepharisma stoltei TaxID=1481888 RepID=A0AAU9IU61_9CILI|nr:unnamed protein product [Blepharisma stoltei]
MYLAKRCIRAVHTLAECISKKEWSKAYSLLSQNSQELAQLDPKLLSSLMWGFNNSNRAKEAYTLLELAQKLEKKPEELDYIAAIEVCMRAGKIDKTLNIFYQSQIFGVSLDSALYEELLGILMKKSDLENVKSVFSCMKKEKINPSFALCIKLIKYGAKKDETILLKEVGEIMNKLGYKSPEKGSELTIKDDFRKKQNEVLSNEFLAKLSENEGDLEKIQGFMKGLKLFNLKGENIVPISINILMRPENFLDDANEEAGAEISEDELQNDSEDDSDSEE